MSCTWGQLADLRANGKRPALTVFVTTDERYARRLMFDLGVMAILQKPGEPMPVELLEGLDVILWLDDCEQAAAVSRLVRRRGVTPASLRAWCRCDRELTVSVGPCDALREIDDLIAAWKPPAAQEGA